MYPRRAAQSLLLIVLCLVVAGWLGVYYFIPAIIATLIAMSTGTFVVLAIALGVAWPVLAVAYVLYVTRETKLRAQSPHDGTWHAPTSTKADGSRVEDP